MHKKRHPYAWRTQMRTWLPWFLIDLGVADKGEDCEKVSATHRCYNIDNIFSGCYHCKGERKGKLWKR